MSKLSIDQKVIKDLLGDKKSEFLIADYQRPYEWGEEECSALWNDFLLFVYPENDYKKFDPDNDEYFLGSIVIFRNEDNKLEIIDGQQRLTTMILMLKAFYQHFKEYPNSVSNNIIKLIENCIWKTDEMGTPNKMRPRLVSDVALDKDREAFHNILLNDNVDLTDDSLYTKNYKFFLDKVADLEKEYPRIYPFFFIRILKNCVILPIEAESRQTALRIFSTLNDRGKPLEDADIFKAQLYKYYSSINRKDRFIDKWKELETVCSRIYGNAYNSGINEAFTRYMYYVQAKKGILQNSSQESLRSFYEKNDYKILKDEKTFEDIIDLTVFWEAVQNQDDGLIGYDAFKILTVLKYLPNNMWVYATSVYYMENKDSIGYLEDVEFVKFLNKINALTLAYTIINPGISALREPMHEIMLDLIQNKEITLDRYKFKEKSIRSKLNNYIFKNNKAITKAMLMWWAMQDELQDTLPNSINYSIESFYTPSNVKSKDIKLVECLGNKSVYDKNVKTRLTDFSYEKRRKYYLGFTDNLGRKHKASKIQNLQSLAQDYSHFTEEDVISRNQEIIDKFIDYLYENGLIG